MRSNTIMSYTTNNTIMSMTLGFFCNCFVYRAKLGFTIKEPSENLANIQLVHAVSVKRPSQTKTKQDQGHFLRFLHDHMSGRLDMQHLLHCLQYSCSETPIGVPAIESG